MLLFALSLSVTAQAPRPAVPSPSAHADDGVLKATLRNGLRVVIVRTTLAPVVSTDLTYLVGSRDDPAGFPGMAHAQEHMMFRGTTQLSTAQLGTIATALGGSFNAQTTDTLTQYQFTVPAADFDAVLRIESDRMHDLRDAQSEWQNERGAIEQEVLRDENAPGSRFFNEAQMAAYAGTPYGHAGVGTKAAFDRLTGPQIKAFYDRWYAPNNAVLVVAGDVDPARALEQIRARFESIPSHPIPPHAAAHFKPLGQIVFDQASRLVYPLAAVGFRLPGVDSPDFVTSFVLQGILDSPRGPIHALVDDGEALDAEWDSQPYIPEAQLGFASAALRPGADPVPVQRRLERILADYAEHGIPPELFASTKRRLIAGQEESRNSTSALASDWATTIALDQQPSIAAEQRLIGAVTLADVNRVARRYLDARHAIIGGLTPSADASESAPPTAPTQSSEKPLAVQSAQTKLPPWGEELVRHVTAPPAPPAPTRMTLANGITLIVQPETISDSVFLYGNVQANAALEEPPGQEGISSVLEAMFDYGTRTQDRTTYLRTLDDANVDESGGASFGLEAPRASFAHGVSLLAQNELDPRFDETTFELAQRRTADALATSLNSTATVVSRRAAQYLLPPNDPELRQPTLTDLQSLTLDDVRAYYAKTMRPDRTTMVVVGNITPDAARAAVERAFGGWHASGDAPPVKLPPLPPNRPGTVSLTIPSGQDSVQDSQIVSLAQAAPQSYPLLLGTAILGGGSLNPDQSRLFRDLRQDAGLVYTVDARLAPRRQRYQFSVEYACLPANTSRIAALIDDEIGRMQTTPVGDFELALAKASIVRQGIVGGASTGAIGGALLDEATNGLPFDQPQRDARAFLAVDAQAIRQSFADYLRPHDFVHIVQGP
ncbi:MAG TPA: pitrilysin family protein [Candidatus Limnocylindria bacterium]|nr:pitrilysin family protein [Candidatus Limnocylindria bacterium]